MSTTLRKDGFEITRYWRDGETRYEVYRGNGSLSNLRREDVEALMGLLQEVLSEEPKPEAKT